MDLRVAKKYRLGPKIGCGSFGEIFEALNVNNGEGVAIKLEPLRGTSSSCLAHERSVYRDLKGGGSRSYGLCHFHSSLVLSFFLCSAVGIAAVRWFGVEGDFNALVIDLLGPSLEKLFCLCDEKLSLKTVLMLADQMISRLEFIHSRSYIHGDIKPGNFTIGCRSTQVHLYSPFMHSPALLLHFRMSCLPLISGWQ